jgi:G3E family GTPase
MVTSPPIPLTVVGGFLGSGKTTLLNHLLVQNEGVRYAVLVNDFGDLAIDEALITSHDGDTIALANGCVCCSIGNDLMAALASMTARAPAPDHIIIEASGVADPARIRNIAHLDTGLEAGPVVVVVDAAQIQSQAGDPYLADTVERQLESANLLILNKCDLAQDLPSVQSWLQQACPDTPLVQCEFGRMPIDLLIGSKFDGESTIEGAVGAAKVIPGDDHHHSQLFKAVTLAVQNPVSREMFENKLRALPLSVLRAKGFVQFGEEQAQWHLIQKSGNHIVVTACSTTPAAFQLVLIGTNEMPDEAWFQSYFEMG